MNESLNELYTIAFNPFKMLTSSYYGLKFTNKFISKTNDLLNGIILDVNKEEFIKSMLKGINMDVDKAEALLLEVDNQDKLGELIDTLNELHNPYIHEMYDVLLIKAYETSIVSKDAIDDFINTIDDTKLISTVSRYFKKKGLDSKIITKLVDLLETALDDIIGIITEFTDESTHGFDEFISDIKEEEETDMENIQAGEEEVVEVIENNDDKEEQKEEFIVLDAKTKKNSKKSSKKDAKKKNKIAKNEDVIVQAIRLDAEDEALQKELKNDIMLDARQNMDLLNAVETLDDEIKLPRFLPASEILESEKIILRYILFTFNDIPEKERTYLMNIKCTTGVYAGMSVLFTDKNNAKFYDVQNKIFIGRFVSYLIEYINDHLDEYFGMKLKEKPNDQTESQFAKQICQVINYSLLSIARGHYAKGLLNICDISARLHYDNANYKIYREGVASLSVMTSKFKSVDDIFKMAYLSCSGSFFFDISKCQNNADYVIALGNALNRNIYVDDIYALFLKARPSIHTKIKNVNEFDDKRNAVLALGFLKLMFDNKCVNKVIRACV